MKRAVRPTSVIGLALALLAIAATGGLAQKPGLDIAGNWTASVLGQTVTASFSRQDKMISGVVIVPDLLTGQKNTYHVAGVFVDGKFAARHGSGHVIQGTVTGPGEAQAVFTPNGGPPMNLTLRRDRPGS
jgi:hypothetical protein